MISNLSAAISSARHEVKVTIDDAKRQALDSPKGLHRKRERQVQQKGRLEIAVAASERGCADL